MSSTVRLLALNASAQILVASSLGWLMVAARQPWARERVAWLRSKAMTATHLDWMMLGFMQALAAFLQDRWPEPSDTVASVLLIYGGWINPLAYVFQALGVDAFSFSGGTRQRCASALLATSAVAISVAWILLLFSRIAM
jgi:hypothetical protein